MNEMTNERLVVLLEARLNQFEKNFQKASGIGTRTYQGLQKGSRSATRQMEQDMARAARSVNQSLASITGNIGAFGKGLIGGAVAGLAAGGVAAITQNAGRIVKGIAEIGNEAKRAGISAQAFQEWKFVAEQNRISVDSLVDGFKELSLRADEFITTGVGPAAEGFTRLGYKASDLKTKLKDPSKLMLEILGRLEGFEKAAQIRIADEVFGGTGGERFVELLGKGQGALQDTINKAHDAGAVMDDQLIARADELDRKFNELTARVTNFGKSVVVAAADAVIELSDLRDKIDDLFPDQAKGRDVLGSEVYDAMAADADLADKNAEDIRHLADEYQYLAQEATNTANRLGDFARELDAAGYSEQAATIRDYADGLTQVTQEYASGQIDAEQFSDRIQDVQSNAENAFASLQDVDGVSFAGARAEMATLGGSIASVIGLARSLASALAAAAGVDAGSKRAAAADRKMAVEQASLDVLEAQTEANKKFTASEDARNTATAETLRLEKVRADVAKRAQDSGARFSDDKIDEFARAQIAADEARAAVGKSGRGGGSKFKGAEEAAAKRGSTTSLARRSRSKIAPRPCRSRQRSMPRSRRPASTTAMRWPMPRKRRGCSQRRKRRGKRSPPRSRQKLINLRRPMQRRAWRPKTLLNG